MQELQLADSAKEHIKNTIRGRIESEEELDQPARVASGKKPMISHHVP